MSTISLTSTWFLNPGCEAEAIPALETLAEAVLCNEPDTLMYLVHTPNLAHFDGCRPPISRQQVVFVEMYQSWDAFWNKHFNGPVFQNFLKGYSHLFAGSDGNPYTTVRFLDRRAGFIRAGAFPPLAPDNRSPSVMFEVLAHDQDALTCFYEQAFGWSYTRGTANFAYIQFPPAIRSLLGGIGQANPKEKGFEAGRNFYLQVENLEAAIVQVLAAGGEEHVSPARVDGYRFAMVKDPEGNIIGLVEPF